MSWSRCTEDAYQTYAESFRDREHVARIQAGATDMMQAALGSSTRHG